MAEYVGTERRRHRMFVTRNTEYHFRDGTCVAVRDRKSGNFRLGHDALRRPITATVSFSGEGGPRAREGEPGPGEAIYFGTHNPPEGRELVTSVLTSVERPPKDLVRAYPA